MTLDAVERALDREPWSFGFFRAVRLLEALNRDRKPVGHGAESSEEAVRFTVHASIAFPPSEIHALERSDGEPARMSVNFFGLTGPQGVLPHHYTTIVADRLRARDRAMADFLDIFHHRILALLYRAWEKHRFTVARETGAEDRLWQHLLDIVGVGTDAFRVGLPLSDDVFAFYPGLLVGAQRSAPALEQWLEAYFGMPAEATQFVGGWYPLADSSVCRIGEGTPSSRLGQGAVVGDEVWDQQARVRVRLGPMDRDRFDDLLPGGAGHETLRAMLRFFSHDQYTFEVQLVLASEHVPGCVIGADSPPQRLGWATWIRTRPFDRDADETVFTI